MVFPWNITIVNKNIQWLDFQSIQVRLHSYIKHIFCSCIQSLSNIGNRIYEDMVFGLDEDKVVNTQNIRDVIQPTQSPFCLKLKEIINLIQYWMFCLFFWMNPKSNSHFSKSPFQGCGVTYKNGVETNIWEI